MDKLKFMQWANKLTETELQNMAVSALKSAPSDLQFDNVGREAEGVKLSGDKQLLAPNGKPSNLNAMQHAQARTAKFKEWFGDWLYNPNMEMTPIKLVDDTDMPDLKDTAAIRRYLKGKFKTEEPVTNIQTGNKIGFFVGGLEAALKNRNTQSRRLFAILPEIISKSAYTGYEENTKLDTKPNIKGYETYYSVVDIDGKLNSVRIVVDIVKDEARGRGYYYHQISEVDLGGAVGKSRSQSDLSQTNYPAPSGLKITLSQLTGKVNNDASKVVDENGEPLVVYHGTDKSFAVKLTIKEGSNGFKLYDHNALEMAKPDSIDAGLSSATPLKNAEKLDYRSISGLPVSLEQMLEAFNGRYDKCLPLEITASNSTDYFIASSPSDSDSIMNIFIKV